MVVSLTAESPPDARTICFQPANNVPLQKGDEQIELLGGAIQHGYVHDMLKTHHGNEGWQMAIIVRNGFKQACQDNGGPLEQLKHLRQE